VVGLVAAAGTLYYVRQTADDDPTPSPMTAGLSFERLTNTYFTAEPTNPFDRPRVNIVRLPPVLQNAAIWGSTGRDDAACADERRETGLGPGDGRRRAAGKKVGRAWPHPGLIFGLSCGRVSVFLPQATRRT
jgi:hypothetical protein